MYYIGIDIGSTSAKTAILDENKNMLDVFAQPTGWSSIDTAESIGKSLREKGFAPEESKVVSTGYGRVAVPFSDKTVTEITCHAKGASLIFGLEDLLVVDIGGQDTKVILIENGFVKDFVMNDKCSAGTGRFLRSWPTLWPCVPMNTALWQSQEGTLPSVPFVRYSPSLR